MKLKEAIYETAKDFHPFNFPQLFTLALSLLLGPAIGTLMRNPAVMIYGALLGVFLIETIIAHRIVTYITKPTPEPELPGHQLEVPQPMPEPQKPESQPKTSISQNMVHSPGGLQVGGDLTIDNIPDHIKQRVTHRIELLTPTVRERLVEKWKELPAASVFVVLVSIANDEPVRFADAITNLLAQVGALRGRNETMGDNGLRDVVVQGNGREAELILSTLSAAGFTVTARKSPTNTPGIAAVVRIGPKSYG